MPIDPSSFETINKLGLGVPEAEKKDRNALGQDEFFDLMIAQLQNQDPLEPLDSNDFLAQVAQFSQVNGIKSIEQSMSQLVTAMESNQALQASTLVGRDVLVPGDVAALREGQAMKGAVELPSSTSDLTVDVLTPAGELVKQIELGTHPGGTVQFSWEGTRDDGLAAPPGNYVIKARAEIAGDLTSVPVMVGARVDSVTVTRNPPATLLNLEGVGPVSVNDVREFI